jgi:hypothetical protein
MPVTKHRITTKYDDARLKAVEKRLKAINADIESAREDKNWSALAALHLRAQKARAEYDECRQGIEVAKALAAEEAEAKKGRRPEDFTPEEWEALVLADAMAATDADLEIAVKVWLDRRGLELQVHSSGLVKVERRRQLG